MSEPEADLVAGRQAEGTAFVRGAAVLAAASLLSRAIGAIYRIPLYAVIGSQGFGLFQMAYPIYNVVLTVSALGVNVAVSRLVAERLAVRDSVGARQVFQTATLMLGVGGLGFAILLLAAARPLSVYVARDPRSFLSFAAIAPAVVFVALESAVRGLFQGFQIMTPTAVSQVVEQLVRVATMFALALLLLPYGVSAAAAGAAFGAVSGGLVGFAYLLWRYRQERERLWGTAPPSGITRARRAVAWDILELSLPISLAGAFMPLISMLDLVLVPARLAAAGFTAHTVTALYGDLTGAAIPLVYLPAVVTWALALSLVPAIAQARANNQLEQVRTRAAAGTRLTVLLTLPAAVGLWVLARPLAVGLYHNPAVAAPLAAMAPAALFFSLQQVTSAVLQGLGRQSLPVRHLAVATVAKVVLGWVLIGTPSIGIRGAAYSTVAALALAASLNLWQVDRLTSGRLAFLRGLGRPALAAAVMGAAAAGTYGALLVTTGHHLASLAAAVLAGALVYLVILALVGGLHRRDLELVPGIGGRLADLLIRLRLLRD